MDKRSSFLVGTAMVVLGFLSLVFVGVTSLLGFNMGEFIWRLWPMVVVGAGLLFVVPPFVARGKRGLGVLFIPGFPILTTGAILFLASITSAWDIWAWLWPMEVLSLTMGFLFAAIYMRVIWLAIPAIIIGLNGLVFQFCAITGLWHWWSVLWTVEPLAVGLSLLAVNVKVHSPGLTTAGLILCGVAGVGALLMVTILGAWWPIMLLGPVLLIAAGLAVLGWGAVRHLLLPRSALE
jgi:hypothetical protein